MKNNWNKEKLISFEKEIVDLYFDNKLPYLFHLSGGNEDQLIEIFKQIQPGDYVVSNHRNHYHALLHGLSPEEIKYKILNGQSMFMYNREKNFFCSAIIGGTPAIAAGIALALKRKNSKQKVWCFIGDGTEDNGHTYEAIRYVDGWDLPCKFIIECNDRSVEASNADRWGKSSNYNWNSPAVIKYNYTITYPHARVNGVIDLSKTIKKTDDEYFPPVKYQNYPDYSELNSINISYKDAIIQSMTELGSKDYVFIGYNVKYGNAMGTLKNIPDSQKIETPVAENLMSGLAIGLSFENILPVLYFERHDFMLVAMDAIGNHIDKIERISHGEYKVPIIIRAVEAFGGPFYSGPTHHQDFTDVLKSLVSFPVIDPVSGIDVLKSFKGASESKRPAIIIERKSRY